MSLAVTTRTTPGNFTALDVSIATTRTFANELLTILACSIPGSVMSVTYSASPLHLSRASLRGIENPTLTSISFVEHQVSTCAPVTNASP